MLKRDIDNEKRLIAAAVIHELWESGNTTQLYLLLVQVKSSVDHPFQKPQLEEPDDVDSDDTTDVEGDW